MSMRRFFVLASILGCFIIFDAGYSNSVMAQETVSDEQVQTTREAAQKALAEDRKEDALDLISQVVIARPTDLSARFFRAQILVALGRGPEIREELVLMASLNLPAED